MTRTDLDLTRKLTAKRIPAEMQGFEAYRLIIWEIDTVTNGKIVYDILEFPWNFTVYHFNANRERWLKEGLQVSLERAVYS